MNLNPIRTALAALLCAGATLAHAELTWTWAYTTTSGTNPISASGSFTTGELADADGYYLIQAITGQRNGEAITGLQATGTPIPGNEPYAVDNRVRASGPQLSGDGFGYATASGNYASPFFASFLSTPGYLEFYSAAPFGPGASNLGPEDSERRVSFVASISTVPEPGGLVLAGLGTALLLGWRYRPARQPQG